LILSIQRSEENLGRLLINERNCNDKKTSLIAKPTPGFSIAGVDNKSIRWGIRLTGLLERGIELSRKQNKLVTPPLPIGHSINPFELRIMTGRSGGRSMLNRQPLPFHSCISILQAMDRKTSFVTL